MTPSSFRLLVVGLVFYSSAVVGPLKTRAQFTAPFVPLDIREPQIPDISVKRDSSIRRTREMMDKMRESMFQGLSRGFPRDPVPGRFDNESEPLGIESPESGAPKAGGLQIQIGELTHPENQRLAIRDADGKRVVARYLVGSGPSRVVVLPDGQLAVRDASETQPTDDRFEAATMDEVRDQWLNDPRLKSLGMQSLESRRFVFIYNTSEPFIRATRTILETMYPAVRKYFSRTMVPTHEPEFPPVFIAFATEDKFQEFERMPQGVVAYYDTNANHVTLFERSKLSEDAPEVAVKNAISTIAHEGVHQILHNIGVQQRLSRWPMWLGEGLPEFFSPTSVDRNARWKGLGATNDLRMKDVVEDVRGGNPLGRGHRLERLVSLDQLDSLDYAYSWSLIHMLARKHRDELFNCIQEASRIKPLSHLAKGSDASREMDQLFVQHFGGDFAGIEGELNRHLSSLRWIDPATNQTHYLVVAGSQVILTTSPSRVESLRRGMVPTQRFQVQRFPNRGSATRAMQAIAR
ncbi:MAG: DUF1570 domain-containing protein [Planctomycetota bacterium]